MPTTLVKVQNKSQHFAQDFLTDSTLTEQHVIIDKEEMPQSGFECQIKR